MSTRPQSAEAILQRLEWTVIRRLDGRYRGDYRSLMRGSGLDMADLREYQLHDDVRHIDWNVTARLQTPYIRQYLEEREVPVWFAIDASRSNLMASIGRSKQDLILELLACLAGLLQRQGNPIGFTRQASRAQSMGAARTGRRHLLQLLDWMSRTPQDLEPAASACDLSPLLNAVHLSLTRRSLLFVISDFLVTPGWEPLLGKLARRHEVIAVRVHDPLEHALPDLGLMMLEDAETGECIEIDTSDPALRTRFAELAVTREEALRATMRRLNIDLLEVGTEDSLHNALITFTQRRRLRRRCSAPAAMRQAGQ